MLLTKQSRLRVEPLEDRSLPSASVVLEWNQLTLNAIRQTGMNTPLASRALAITQAAVYDAVVAIDRSFEPYHAHVQASHGASLEAAAAQAAHDTLAALFPTLATTFDAPLAADLAGIPPGLAMQGVAVGHEAARQILDWRSTDGSTATVTYTPGTDPGDWQPTPPANLPALAPHWRYVIPFAMTSGSQFRPAAPPELDTAAYAAAFNEVKSLGRADSTTRTAEQTQIAFFWRDGAGTSYAFGHWNTIAQGVSTDRGLDLVAAARLFALLNVATADALISTWDAKYEYNLWRPVTAIRAADTDNNPATEPDASWSPLLVTPNFPSYTSAHSTVSAAASGVLTALFGDDYHFTVGSEGLAGVTRSFASFDAAAAEAGRSRVYGGIHYQFDSTAGLEAGAALADFVVGGFLQSRAHEGNNQARPAAPAPLNNSPHADQVPPLSFGALARRPAAGVDPSALRRIDVRSAGPGGLTWNTPGNSELATSGGRGDRGRPDRFQVPTQEVGRLLHHEDEWAGAMAEPLSGGVRQEPGRGATADPLPEAIFAPFGADGEPIWIGRGGARR